eukprot:4630993-Amphidinium_carterae.1
MPQEVQATVPTLHPQTRSQIPQTCAKPTHRHAAVQQIAKKKAMMRAQAKADQGRPCAASFTVFTSVAVWHTHVRVMQQIAIKRMTCPVSMMCSSVTCANQKQDKKEARAERQCSSHLTLFFLVMWCCTTMAT